MTVELIEDKGVDQRAIDTYHRILYSLHEDDYPHWMGVLIRKNPLDLWIYAEIIQRTRPDVIIELGTAKGGSALFFSAMQRMIKSKGIVVTVDEKPCPEGIIVNSLPAQLIHVEGMTQDPAVAREVQAFVAEDAKVMLSHDAGHLTHEVLADLELYAPLVTPGMYCVVEDTNIEGRPLGHQGVQGPWTAVERFLAEHPEFERDEQCERFGLTFNPGGWLVRK